MLGKAVRIFIAFLCALQTFDSGCSRTQVQSLPLLVACNVSSAGGTLGGANDSGELAQALAESLAALPRLADQRDREQVEGITRLARVLQVGPPGRLYGWFASGSL
jgi:hypothetical protein